MNKTIFIILPAAIALMLACEESSEFELEKSVYEPDLYFPSLPAYTEWGYNTFGAYYDRKLFIYSEDEVPAKVINTGGITRFVLKGSQGVVDINSYYPYDYYGGYIDMSISFDLPGFLPETYTDLVTLDSTVFDLADPDCNITTTIGADTVDMEILNGELRFKRAQHLFVDERSVKVILSGTFNFQALVEGDPISISYGRFDVGLGDYNFFRY
jgi:hypothetical protein